MNVEEKVEERGYLYVLCICICIRDISMTGSPGFGNFSNNIEEREDMSVFPGTLLVYGTNKIIKKREDELAQYIKNLLKAVTFKVH